MQMPAVCSSKTLDHSNLATLSYPQLIAVATSPAAPPPAQTVTPQDALKRIAAHRAVEHVKSGMVLGLGTGSTAIHALERIADLLRSGELTDIVGIPTSKKTEGEARALGIPLCDLESNPNIDLSIDGADEVDPFLNLVKGRGGSLLREKMIEGASKRFVVIVDESKWVEKLGGSKMAVPVEVIPFGWKHNLTRLKKIFDGKVGFDARLRMKGEEIFVTDNLNYIIDLFFENWIVGDLNEISNEILRIVGVVEHGMFLGMATEVIIAGKDGVVVKNIGEVDATAEQRRLTFASCINGHCCWRMLPKLAGLRRCGKSCRLRWTNYLRPDLKRGLLTESEEQLVIDLHSRLGNRIMALRKAEKEEEERAREKIRQRFSA